VFTGLIEQVGTVVRSARRGPGMSLWIEADSMMEGLAEGDSIAVDGACLTVEDKASKSFVVFLSPETLSRTTFGSVRSGRRVNLERALRLSDRLGGHLVQGHVDGKGVVTGVSSVGDAREIVIKAPKNVQRYLVDKGSITVDGVSLTAMKPGVDSFTVSVIPQTLERTTLKDFRPGQEVNLEADLVAKYVEKLLGLNPGTGVGMDLLARKGYLL